MEGYHNSSPDSALAKNTNSLYDPFPIKLNGN